MVVVVPGNQIVTDDLGCVKTLRGITAPGILGSVVMRRAKKRKNLSSARHYNQIRFRFRTAKTHSGYRQLKIAAVQLDPNPISPIRKFPL